MDERGGEDGSAHGLASGGESAARPERRTPDVPRPQAGFPAAAVKGAGCGRSWHVSSSPSAVPFGLIPLVPARDDARRDGRAAPLAPSLQYTGRSRSLRYRCALLTSAGASRPSAELRARDADALVEHYEHL